jgi:hypothetical protein
MSLPRQLDAPAYVTAPLHRPADVARSDAFPPALGSLFFGASFQWLRAPMHRARDVQMSMRRVDVYSSSISSSGILMFMREAKVV